MAVSSLALLTTGWVSLGPAQAATSDPVADQPVRVHWNNGKPLAGKSGSAPGQVVKSYLSAKGVGQAASTLSNEGSWKSRGLTVLRFGQTVGGLRVPGTDAKAVFDSDGDLVSVIENTAKVTGKPVAASAGPDDALRSAVASLYPKRSVNAASGKQHGNTTSYAAAGWAEAPTVETVALPTTTGKPAVGYEVTTWTTGNQLNITTVNGSGQVVDNENRTNNESYKVFPEHPGTTPQTTVPGNGGWLSGGPQWTNHISGNNANAYLDTNDDNKADTNATSVPSPFDFSTTWDGTKDPATVDNRAVAVQNLFWLNNVIHDTLYDAGFTEAAGNFQEDNFGNGGRASDAVQAEAQDGGGTDNANFATPNDGQNPRMQMYLWHQPTTHAVEVAGGPTLVGAGAEWGTQLTDTVSATGALLLADDGTAPATDACTNLTPGSANGKIVIADRGSCNFTVKAKNAQSAGAVGIVVVNNTGGAPSTMGGTDATVTIPGVMVAQADRDSLLAQVGKTATLKLRSPAPLLIDASLDSDVVWHEYGHGLTWRMIGGMKGPLAGAIGEGMGDVLAVIANDDPVVGEYSATDPFGIRSAPYDQLHKTYGDIVGAEVHADGEVYGAIGWAMLKAYQADGRTGSQLLADLVNGMNFTPSTPTYEAMRDGILHGIDASALGAQEKQDRSCNVWESFARYGVGVGAVGKAAGKKAVTSETFTTPPPCADVPQP